MQKGQPSRTALMTAVYRARENLAGEDPKLLEDMLALPLSGLPDLNAINAFVDNIIDQFAALSDRASAEDFIRVSSEVVCLRARLVEEEFKRMCNNGVSQVVILGAGLDSMCYRYAPSSPDIDFIEVDHPDTQAWKRDRLAQAGINIPENTRFVGFNFEHQTLGDALQTGQVDKTKPTLFSWMGVCMYLTDETVKATLNILGTFAPGSALIMDFLMPDYSDAGNVAPDGVNQLRQVVAEMGEPMLSLYTPPDLDKRLREAGFSDVSFPLIGDLVDLYLNGKTDRVLCPLDLTTLLVAKT